jgi:hypothetical protein
MALRENQVYQIGLIISVMLTVVLGLLAFFGFSSASQEGVRAQEAETKLKQERSVRESAESAVTAMKIMIGASSSESLETAVGNVSDEQLKKDITDVQTMFNNDLRLFASGSEDPATRSYSSLVKNLITVVNSTNTSLRVENENVNIANAEKKTDVDKANARAEGLQQEVTTLNARVAQLQTDLESAKTDFAAKLAAAEAAHNQGAKAFRDQIASLTTERDALNTKANKTEQVLNAKVVQLQQYERKKFLIADGRIVDLSPTTGRVYVNLGSEDGLYRKISFSVFGRGVELEAGLEKATVEITNILGPHSSEARILSHNERDPILPNDQIVTATWEPGGYKVPVAISGIIDLNGDGESDLERLKGFIAKNQGVLAAVMNEVGEIEGKIDLNTRYLIVGDEPQDDRARQAFSKLDLDAGTYRVQKISVREFLHLNGFHPEPNIRSMDSLDRKIDGFEPRRPPANGSAFSQ